MARVREVETSLTIARRRLHSQRLAGRLFDRPADVVEWFGAVQAQEYRDALWAVGLRARGAAERDVEQAIADREIVRTWPMRGTLHFVAPVDVRWMLKLLAPRIVAANAKRLAQDYGLDDATFLRSRDVVEATLQGGRRLTRRALYQALDAAGIATANSRGMHIVGRLAQNGTVCFGLRDGKQPTFVLLDEWVPASRMLEGDEALAELARRYFTAHGPATVQDLAWWSGMRAADARRALDLARPMLAHDELDGRTYWLSPDTQRVTPLLGGAHLLPAFDEYLVGYTDRTAALDDINLAQAEAPTALLSPAFVVDGRVLGTWKRVLGQGRVTVALDAFNPLDGAQRQALATAEDKYGGFLGLPVELA